ncbi:MAG: ester cyclase [Chloroflexota bacterium]
MTNPNCQNQQNKSLVWDFWRRLDYATPDQFGDLFQTVAHPDINWNGSQPLNQIIGIDAVVEKVWHPLRAAFPDLKRQTDIFLGGLSGGEAWVAGHGYLVGTFANDWLGIPATGDKAHIRFGQFYVMRDGKIAESYVIFDMLDVIRQAGYQLLPPSRGAEGGKVIASLTGDGIMFMEQDALETRQTAQLIHQMGRGMRRYNRHRDGGDLSSMSGGDQWHHRFHWYGPCGIGSSYTLEEYEDFHQRPWLEGFGDRNPNFTGGRILGIGDDTILAEGNYAALGIWDTPYSRHNGTYMGIPASGKIMTLRDFDWYRREGNYLVQNWVPIDLVDLFLQMGVDLFAQLQMQIEAKKQNE